MENKEAHYEYCDLVMDGGDYSYGVKSPHQEPDYKIGYCTHCMQSTNHLKEICQKCKPHQEPVSQNNDDLPEEKYSDFLMFCEKCIQMTNHLYGICQKCKPQEPMEWAKEWEKFITGKLKQSHANEIKQFISELIKQAEERGQLQERQFILNILDGVDKADEEMGNKGGGTLAIRHALKSRFITNQ